MRWDQQLQYASKSDVGFRRSNNQDACIVQLSTDMEMWKRRGNLFVVADGMGGHAVGELASKIAVDTLPHTYFKSQKNAVGPALKQAIEAANAAIYDRGQANNEFNQMGTTCTALVLCSQGAIVGHVGDSRAYRIRKERIEQLTFDHSLQWEMIREGKLSRKKAEQLPSNVITRSLGPNAQVEVDIEGPYATLPGDVFVLCSDGLIEHVSDEEIGTIAGEFPPETAGEFLIQLANLRGGSDNVTVVIARVLSIPHVAPAPVEEDDEFDENDGSFNAWGLVLAWVTAILFTMGSVGVLLGKRGSGFTMLGLSAVMLIAGIGYWLARRRTSDQQDEETRILQHGPYRRASATPSEKTVSQLSAIVRQLGRMAKEENWSIDWSTFDPACKQAEQASHACNHAEALKHYVSAIQVMMPGVHEFRRRRQQAAQESPPE